MAIEVTSGAVVYRNGDKGIEYLLLESQNKGHFWGFPKGHVEGEESLAETAIREIKEETNLNIKKENLKIFNIFSGEEQHHIYPNKDEVYFVNIIFETNIYNGEIVCDYESYELKFFDIDKLPSNITKPFESVSKDLKERIKNSNI